MMIKLAASMMCSDYAHLERDVRDLESSGIDLLHCDIMDGHYVPNIIVGPDYIRTLRSLTDLRLDFHFMVENPEFVIGLYELQPGERVCFHYETIEAPERLVSKLKQQGLEVGIAISPSRPLEDVISFFKELDFLHVMMVKPGFAGQSIIPEMVDRLVEISRMLKEMDLELDIEIDGSVLYENTPELINSGATTLVLGPTNCFNRELGIIGAVQKEREIVLSIPQ